MSDRSFNNGIIRLGALHDIDDDAISANLLAQLDAEGNWIAYVPRSNGEVHLRSRVVGQVLPPEKHQWTLELVEAINRHFRGSGWAWVIAWTSWQNSCRILLMPKDEDGDVPSQIDIEDAWGRLRKAPKGKFVEDAVDLYNYIAAHYRALGLTRENMHSPAQKGRAIDRLRA